MDNPKSNWFQWLGKELEKEDYKVWIPKLPHAEKPNPCNYNPFLLDGWKYDKDTIMIGHSSGATAIINLLNNTDDNFQVGKAIMVAGFKDDLNWDPTRDLFIYPWDMEKVKKKADKFILIHSDNDSYVSVDHGEWFKDKLGEKAQLVIMKDQGHFSIGSAGEKYKEFPELLQYI